MAVQLSYSDRAPKGHAGMISDTSPHNVDGATAGTASIRVGRPVVFTGQADDTKLCREMSEAESLAGKFVGISVFSHYANYAGAYAKGDAVNVLRSGRIWAACADANAPRLGAPVACVADGVSATGTPIPGWAFTGEYDKDANGNPIAEVELIISRAGASA